MPMIDILDEKTVTVRKRHQCWRCGEWIEPGERAVCRSLADQGDAWSVYWHPDCFPICMACEWVDDCPGAECRRWEEE